MAPTNRRSGASQALDHLLKHYAKRLPSSHGAFWRLVYAIRARSPLLNPLLNRGDSPLGAMERLVLACARMADHHAWWQRTPEMWVPFGGGPFLQFHSLVSHLFDAYPVPKFLAPIWASEFEKPWELDLYLHLAAGKSIRQFQWPLAARVTKRAAVFFMQAPDDLLPIQAYRWAHVRSLGGDDRLARLLMQTPSLCAPREDETFWETVIRFLIKNLPISNPEISEIVWFIDQQRFRPAEVVWGPGAGQQPLQPDFSLKGRSLMSLRRHMANWRTELQAKISTIEPSTQEWEKTNIQPFRQSSGDSLWTIEELLSDKELRVEGGIMQHCVASYIQACSRRRTSIWSMKLQQGERRKRLLTIEVVPSTNTIWQAKGKRNSPPTETEMEMLRRWVDQEGLRFR